MKLVSRDEVFVGNYICDSEKFDGNQKEILTICRVVGVSHNRGEFDIEYFWIQDDLKDIYPKTNSGMKFFLMEDSKVFLFRDEGDINLFF